MFVILLAMVVGRAITNDLVVTRGNPPAAAMFYAKENAKQQIVKICKEVFGND